MCSSNPRVSQGILFVLSHRRDFILFLYFLFFCFFFLLHLQNRRFREHDRLFLDEGESLSTEKNATPRASAKFQVDVENFATSFVNFWHKHHVTNPARQT